MNKVILVALMTSLLLTIAGLAPAIAASHAAAREPVRVQRTVLTPGPTWTCAHNTYRSVVCS